MTLFDVLYQLSDRIFWSMWVSVGFAMLFNTPKRAMPIVALMGGIGWTVKFTLLETAMTNQVVLTSLIGSCVVGFLSMYFAHKIHTPPIVFTIPAVINMIPGKYGYEFMMGMIDIATTSDSESLSVELLFTTIKKGLQTFFITMGLSFGVIVPMLIFNTYSLKGNKLNKFIENKVMRRNKRKNYDKQG